MASERVKLYGAWISPFSHRIEIALKLKGVPYDYIEEDLLNKSPDLLRYNPVHKKVPVLVHNDKSIVESQIILEYIDETWPGHPIMPQDPYDRAMARFWANFIDDKCLTSTWKALFWTRGEEQRKALEEAEENLGFMEKELEKKKLFGGENFGFVDMVANSIAIWVAALQEATGKVVLTEEKYPCAFKWAQEYTCRNIIKETSPPRDHLAAFYKARMEMMEAMKDSK